MQTAITNLREMNIGSGHKVDREAGVIRDVKVIGTTSKNNRSYKPEALAEAASLYNKRPVYTNHIDRKSAKADRDVLHKFAWLENVRQDAAGGLTGDLHYLKSHPMGPVLAEAAERNPEQFGLSHDADGEVSYQEGKAVVTKIKKVNSVDLVTDPATTLSLFESEQPKMFDSTVKAVLESLAGDKSASILESLPAELHEAQIEIESADPSRDEQLLTVFSVLAESKFGIKPQPQDNTAEMKESLASQAASIEQLTKAVSELKESLEKVSANKPKPSVSRLTESTTTNEYPKTSEEALKRLTSRY